VYRPTRLIPPTTRLQGGSIARASLHKPSIHTQKDVLEQRMQAGSINAPFLRLDSERDELCFLKIKHFFPLGHGIVLQASLDS
jgi:hypothetical protein